MIISSHDKPLEDILRDMKGHTSSVFRKLLKGHSQESRTEWIISMMEKEGKKNSNNIEWQFWQQHNKPIEILDQKMFVDTGFYIH